MEPSASGSSKDTTEGAAPSSAPAESSEAEAPLDPEALTIYNAQHENLAEAWAAAFTAETGIKVQMRNGSDLEMANQIAAEGTESPADVFITENSPGMNVVEAAGLFTPVEPATLAQIPSQYSPSTNNWVGVAARSTVLVYNTSKFTEDQLPASIMDLAKPEWKGRWAASPGGADFQAIISAMYELEGEAATEEWLTGMEENFVAYKGNSTVMKAVNAGEVDAGVIYHYYWYGDQAKTKENSSNTALHFFGNKDPGAFVSVSGAGVLASSMKQEQAQQFLAFITSAAGQKIVADTVLEYPLLDTRSETNKALQALSSLDAPVVDPASLNSEAVVDLMTAVGIL